MNDYYIRNECLDIFESLELLDSLKFAHNLIELVTCAIQNEVETKEDFKSLNELKKISTKLFNIVKENDK